MVAYPTVKQPPHAAQVNAIVRAMIKMTHQRRREMFEHALAYVHAQCGPTVGNMYDFINAEPTETITAEVKERVLGQIRKACEANDASLLQP